MPSIHRSRSWTRQDLDPTPESVYLDRRRFLKQMGILGLTAYGIAAGCAPATGENAARKTGNFAKGTLDLYPAHRNASYVLDRPLTDEEVAATYNNFYEFSLTKDRVWRLVDRFEVEPWSVTVDGLVEKARTVDFDALVRRFTLEERLCRHRCVEAWSMAVPWTGFPLADLVRWAGVTSDARYVRFESFLEPEQAPNQNQGSGYRWPYYEGLRMDEALNEAAFVVTGIYGHPLPKQHGAPLRIVLPWKYGFKGPKSIRRITFTAERPPTFWNDLAPNEYGFLGNVDPGKPHPRWSQATERVLGTGDRVPTRLYNGYGALVAGLYR